MTKIDQIKDAIRNGVNRQSKLTDECFGIGSFTSPAIRHILNNLGAISNNYLEVGLHRGGTFVAACYGNTMTATGNDNWTQFADNATKQDCLNGCEKFLSNYKIIDKDCFSLTKEDIPEPIDLYFFDGEHGYDSQKAAITYFKQFLADECIVVIDDASWPDVRKGTYDGIKEVGFDILHEVFLWDGIEGSLFWNGLYIFLLKK